MAGGVDGVTGQSVHRRVETEPKHVHARVQILHH